MWQALIPAALQAGLGAAQYFGGRKMSKTPTPDYEIPTEFFRISDTQRASMLGDMPGATKARQDIQSSTANQLEAAERYGQLDPNTVSAAYGQQQGNFANLGATEAMYKTREKDKWLNTQQQLGGLQLQKQEWETLNPFLAQMQNARDMMGAGIQNVWGGIGSAGDYMMYNGSNSNSQGAINRYAAQVNPNNQKAQQKAYDFFKAQHFGIL